MRWFVAVQVVVAYIVVVSPAPVARAAAIPVQVVEVEAGQWQLHREGKPYFIMGAGGGGPKETLAAAGANVLLLGPMPTPAVAYLTRTLYACAGIVISASHNSYEDNGIKFFDGAGSKLTDDVEKAMEEAGADAMTAALRADIAEQLEKEHDVAYTAISSQEGFSAARVAGGEDEVEVDLQHLDGSPVRSLLLDGRSHRLAARRVPTH